MLCFGIRLNFRGIVNLSCSRWGLAETVGWRYEWERWPSLQIVCTTREVRATGNLGEVSITPGRAGGWDWGLTSSYVQIVNI